MRSFIPFLVLCLASAGCPTASDDDDAGPDDDDSIAGDDDDSIAEDDDDFTPDESLSEVVSFVHVQGCAGCQDFLLFGQPYSETVVITSNISFQAEPVLLFADERLDAAVRGLEPETCQLFDPAIFEPPSADCLDAGELTYGADWPGWETPAVDFHDTTHNYPSSAFFGSAVADYAPGRALTLEGSGGADVGPFVAEGRSVEPLDLLEPLVDGDQLPDVDFTQPLNVRWSGGEADTVRVYLIGERITPDWSRELLGCHALNDGEIAIPSELLAGFDLGEITQLYVSDRLRYGANIEEIPIAGWTLGSASYTYVAYDPVL